jgi:hypothetical protein
LSGSDAAIARPNGQCEVQQSWRAMRHIIGLTNDHIRLEAVNRSKGRRHAPEKQREYRRK